MSRPNAAFALPPDERPAALRQEDARPARPTMLGTELLEDDIDEHIAAANQASAEMRRARTAHDVRAERAAALQLRKALQVADALARSVQMGASRHLRREPRIRS